MSLLLQRLAYCAWISALAPLVCCCWVLPELGVHQQRSISRRTSWFADNHIGASDKTATSEPTVPTQHLLSQIDIAPLRIELKHLSVEFPVTWTQTLFSAVPRRRWALKDVSLCVDKPQVLVLTGDSSAGKSTLLKVVAGHVTPTEGSVTVSSSPPFSHFHHHAVYLEASANVPKYDYGASSRGVPLANWLDRIITKCDSNKRGKARVGNGRLLASVAQALAEYLLSIFWTADELSSSDINPSSWSQSQLYRTRLFEASMESMLQAAVDPSSSSSPELSQNDDDNTQPISVAPLLLLDEWLDRETSSVIQSVQASLERLVLETGAMVLVVTHYPERWRLEENDTSDHSASTTRRVVLSMGKLSKREASGSSSRDFDNLAKVHA